MHSAVFIGDELTAAGFRLCGIQTITVPAEALAAAFDDALAHADLVLIGASTSLALPKQLLEAALQQRTPLVSIVPDATGQLPEDMNAQVRRALGLG